MINTATAHKRHERYQNKLGAMQIFMVSAWSFTMVISSSLASLFVGRWLDIKFNTEPTFMLGLFILVGFLCIYRMYEEVSEKGKRL